jgi:hypothetical protein
MALLARLLGVGVLVIGLAIAPAGHAERWHGGWEHHEHHHGGGNAAGAAIIGGLIGLGVGAAIASNGGYYAPPYGYYAPPQAYYTPPPPPVYYGYGY